MLYVSSCKGNIIEVTDTLNSETDNITEEECKKYVKAGLEIQGIQLNGDSIKVNSIESDIARHKLLNDGWEIEIQEGKDIWFGKDYLNQTSRLIKLQKVPDNTPDKVLKVPDYIVQIGASCFYNRTFKEIKLSKNLVAIGSSAFTKSSGLRKVILPECFRWVGEGAFARCNDLQYVEFPKYVYTLNRGLFNGCNSLREVVLPRELGINSLDMEFFRDCRELKRVNLGETNITVLYRGCFQGCVKLESIDLSNIKKLDERCFIGCLGLKEVTIPNVRVIPEFCFAKTGLEHITISDGVEVLSDACFLDTDIKTIEIPKSVMYIGSMAFSGCGLLEKVIVKNEATHIEPDAFNNCSDFHVIRG